MTAFFLGHLAEGEGVSWGSKEYYFRIIGTWKRKNVTLLLGELLQILTNPINMLVLRANVRDREKSKK